MLSQIQVRTCSVLLQNEQSVKTQVSAGLHKVNEPQGSTQKAMDLEAGSGQLRSKRVELRWVERCERTKLLMSIYSLTMTNVLPIILWLL